VFKLGYVFSRRAYLFKLLEYAFSDYYIVSYSEELLKVILKSIIVSNNLVNSISFSILSVYITRKVRFNPVGYYSSYIRSYENNFIFILLFVSSCVEVKVELE